MQGIGPDVDRDVAVPPGGSACSAGRLPAPSEAPRPLRAESQSRGNWGDGRFRRRHHTASEIHLLGSPTTSPRMRSLLMEALPIWVKSPTAGVCFMPQAVARETAPDP